MSNLDEISGDGRGLGQRRTLGIWFGVLGPLVVAFAQQQTMYAFVDWACAARARVLVHIPVLATLAVIGFATALSWREWKDTAQIQHETGDGAMRSRRFFALVGLASSAVGTALVIAQWIPAFLFDPCQH